MSTESPKQGFPVSPYERGESSTGASRRWSLRGRLSALFSQIESESREAAASHAAARADRDALRQRLTPTSERVESAARLASGRPELARTHAARADWSGSLTDLPWPGGIPDPEWKPVVLAEGEAAPALPTLDELAAEAGIPPSVPRFPPGS